MQFMKSKKLDVKNVTESFENLSDDYQLICDNAGMIIAGSEKFLQRMQLKSIKEVTSKSLKLADILKNTPYSLNGFEYLKHIEEEAIEADFVVDNKTILVEVRAEKFNDNSYLILLKNIQALRKAQKAKHYFESFKNKFLTNISHEFRTPMNGIIGFVDLLDSTILNTIQKEYVTLISRSSSNMMNSIENLIELMQIESGEIDVVKRLFNPIESFETFSLRFCEVARQKGVQLFFVIDPHIPHTLFGDMEKIEKVLKNLILNAIKFTDENGLIVVELSKADVTDGVEITYSVTDSGEGIAKEKIPSLLMAFASARGNQERGKDGLGVGLNVSHHLLEMMDSSLHVTSELNRGSKFSFTLHHNTHESSKFEYMEGSRVAIWAEDKHTEFQATVLKKYLEYFEVDVINVDGMVNKSLTQVDALFILTNHLSRTRLQSLRKSYPNLQIVPVVEPQNESKFSRLLDVVESVVTLPLLPTTFYDTLSVIWKKVPKAFLKKSIIDKNFGEHSSTKVLIAEDNPINLKLLQTILMQAQYRVKAVENGQLAVDAYMKESFDIVLMDIDMPVMDGITATRLIKEIDHTYNRKRAPIIALTAHALSGDKERILEQGLDAHLAKPIEKEALLQTMGKFLQIKVTNSIQLGEAV